MNSSMKHDRGSDDGVVSRESLMLLLLKDSRFHSAQLRGNKWVEVMRIVVG